MVGLDKFKEAFAEFSENYVREFGITQDPTAGLQMDIDYRAIRRVA